MSGSVAVLHSPQQARVDAAMLGLGVGRKRRAGELGPSPQQMLQQQSHASFGASPHGADRGDDAPSYGDADLGHDAAAAAGMMKRQRCVAA